ncbi:LysR substrate-binding domain-containing protein [Micromonospora sp. DSM 115977]|uniref:LysR substrate-binding domain-containing protein n=1 Tax=Micromonospora reichwaldensis TaxID=3075516 RepID=A0ABU2WXC3_9ACTN|nr:LysR substrate-binding domain-containing protein [Micromonospora sp. DSM 115977]MDT0530579.1 LysR substrate-binding domain-containing protein [Micromonospora sp. DSM 115977]
MGSNGRRPGSGRSASSLPCWRVTRRSTRRRPSRRTRRDRHCHADAAVPAPTTCTRDRDFCLSPVPGSWRGTCGAGRGGDLALATFPVDEPDIGTGPVLVSEARFLAVPVGHPFAGRDAVSVEDLADVTMLQLPDTLPSSLRADRTPHATPAGRPISAGLPGATFHEILTHVGAGLGVFPYGDNARRYYARPDVAYVHLRDAQPLRWGLLWRADGATARVRAFAEVAQALTSEDR